VSIDRGVRGCRAPGEDAMPVELNHTIVPSRDKNASARFLAEVLGMEAGREWGPFVPVETANGVILYYMDVEDAQPNHYCFMVTESEFDQVFKRLKERGIDYWADPEHRRRGEINQLFGGRGVYFDDPDGHNLEVITRPYA
jgi:catechol 2,3-dioxygenase-like lactoylglutathione lyase family enzyme